VVASLAQVRALGRGSNAPKFMRTTGMLPFLKPLPKSLATTHYTLNANPKLKFMRTAGMLPRRRESPPRTASR
jgi:hypothetical protein